MRLVTKLEKRFNVALEKLELDAIASADSDEIEALSKQLSELKAILAEKDETITTLTSQVAGYEKTNAGAVEKDAKIATLTSQFTEIKKLNEAAAIRISGLKETVVSAQEQAAKSQEVVEVSQATEAAAEKKITNLQDKLDKAQANASGSADSLAKIEDLEDMVDSLKSRVKISEANALNHYEKMRRLRGAHRAVRASLKGNVLNAEEVNTAMEAELEALQMQREIDLNEVNIVLEKLTPLVEGK